MPKIYFYIEDLKKAIVFNHRLEIEILDEEYNPELHVKLSSDSFNFLLKNEFGFDTLMVNGRFRSSSKNNKKMFRAFAIASLNNMGYSLNWKIFLQMSFFKRVFEKLLMSS